MNGKAVHATSRLHPRVYAALVCLAAFFVVSAWIGFAASGNTDYLLFVMSAFVAMAVALPTVVWITWRHHRRRDPGQEESFADWARGEFDIGKGHMSGASAAIEILLPIAAVAFGMLAFAILARLLA